MELGSLGFLALNKAKVKWILTLGFLTAGWATRRLPTTVGFIILLSLVHGFSNDPPAKVRVPTGRQLLLELVGAFNCCKNQRRVEVMVAQGLQSCGQKFGLY
jgi:hypothetical protein